MSLAKSFITENQVHSDSHRHQWIAFWLSIALPGLGQLWSKRASGLMWIAAILLNYFLLSWAIDYTRWAFSPNLITAISFSLGLVIALTSAEHAKRCFENQSPWPKAGVLDSKVTLFYDHHRRIISELTIDVSLSKQELWRRVSNLKSFLTIDPFHAEIHLDGNPRYSGTRLAIVHRVFGIKFIRIGKMLRWREGCGYSFSDLNLEDTQSGYPHVFHVEVQPQFTAGKTTSQLKIRVAGKWNHRWLPTWIAANWVRWVMRQHARILSQAL